MKHQILYINNKGEYFLFGLCLFLIFLLSLTYSSIIMAQDYNWGNPQNLLNFDWVYDLDMSSWNNNLNTLTAPVFTIDQGRSGFQAQAPLGVQVLSARSKHTLYSFWARPDQNQFGQNYYPVYLNMNNLSPYQTYPYMQNPLISLYDEPYWSPTASISPIGPSMLYAEPYWMTLGGSGALYPIGSSTSTESSGSIGPSMLYGETYWHPGYGASSMNLGW